MALSILYCGECDAILAAAIGISLVAECVAHTVKDTPHTGYRALRLVDVNLSSMDLADLTALAAKYPKADYAKQLEPLAGCCP